MFNTLKTRPVSNSLKNWEKRQLLVETGLSINYSGIGWKTFSAMIMGLKDTRKQSKTKFLKNNSVKYTCQKVKRLRLLKLKLGKKNLIWDQSYNFLHLRTALKTCPKDC
jgi:hypothetical protein